MARIGLFGGTFNPVHNGHLVLAQEAMQQASLDELLFIPNATPSHKRSAELLPATLRVELLQLAIAGVPGFSIDEQEIRRGGVSYSIDTLRALAKERPQDEFLFLIGTDSLAELHRWKDAGELLQRTSFLVHPRTGFTGPWPVLDLFSGAHVQFMLGTVVDISSTMVRERFARGQSLRGYVPESVEDRLKRG